MLAQEGIDYRILGSVGVAATLDETAVGPYTLDTSRKTDIPVKRYPDLDILVPRSQLAKTIRVQGRLIDDPEAPVHLGIANNFETFDFRPGEETSYLRYKNVKVPVKTEIFDPVDAEYHGVKVVTVDPRTLLHTFVTIGGGLRDKDIRPARLLTRQAKDGSGHDEADYKGFHEFIKQRRAVVRANPSHQRFVDLVDRARIGISDRISVRNRQRLSWLIAKSHLPVHRRPVKK